MARDLIKCAIVFGVMHGPLLVQCLTRALKMKLLIHCKATKGELDALVKISFREDLPVKVVSSVVKKTTVLCMFSWQCTESGQDSNYF